MLCIAHEVGRLWLAGCSEQERGWAPRGGFESWLGLMHEVGLLLVPLWATSTERLEPRSSEKKWTRVLHSSIVYS